MTMSCAPEYSANNPETSIVRRQCFGISARKSSDIFLGLLLTLPVPIIENLFHLIRWQFAENLLKFFNGALRFRCV